jgi:hypothetical protein
MTKPTIKQALARKRVEKTLALLKSVRCDNFVVIGRATWQTSKRGYSKPMPRSRWVGR